MQGPFFSHQKAREMALKPVCSYTLKADKKQFFKKIPISGILPSANETDKYPGKKDDLCSCEGISGRTLLPPQGFTGCKILQIPHQTCSGPYKIV